MSEIKVGQIYKSKLTFTIRAVTFIDDSEVSMVHLDGFVDRWGFDELETVNWELIAEYPTWQEAVNSKEFKND